MTTASFGRRAVLAGAGALLTLTACGPRATDGKVLRVGYQKNGVLLVAKRRGGLDAPMKAAGVEEVRWLEFQSGPPLLEALSVGSVDIGVTGDAPPIFAQAAGAKIRYVAQTPLSGQAGGVLAPRDNGVFEIADLKGKRLCFTRGSSAHTMAVDALTTAGLTLDDVEAVNLSPADAAAAFAQGGIDGWVIWDPFYTAAVRDQRARVLITGDKLGGGAAYVLASAAYVESQPEALKAALAALAEQGRWAEDNRLEVAALTAEETGLDPELMRLVIERADFQVKPLTPERIAAQQVIADRFVELGVAPAKVSIQDAAWTGWSGA